jgi:tripartite-type tricarboxylate transporter receptor subunit TctC
MLAPQQPSFSELGLENAHIELWFGIYGPAKLPQEIVEKWNRELPVLLDSPDLKEAWLKQGLVPKFMPAAEFTGLTRSEVARWRAVVEKAGIQPE